MRRLPGVIAIVFLSNMALSCLVEVGKEPKYASEKPLYARLALDRKATTTLTLVFDESQGTGKGYDTVHADVNFNSDLTDDKATKRTLRDMIFPSSPLRQRTSLGVSCDFPPIQVDVPYSEEGKQVQKPWWIDLYYEQHEGSRFFGLAKPETVRRFILEAGTKRRDGPGEWAYSFGAVLQPAESLPSAKAVDLGGKPSLQVLTQPDRRNKGNMGIAASLVCGDVYITCAKGGRLTIPAHLQIKNEQGKIIHSEDVGLDKLVFG